MSILEVYPAIGAMIFIVTLLFTFLPEKITGSKNEYISYVLWDLSVLWLVNVIIMLSGFEKEHPASLMASIMLPVSAIIYWIFPFKSKRNKTLAFLLTSFAAIEIIGLFAVSILVSLSNM